MIQLAELLKTLNLATEPVAKVLKPMVKKYKSLDLDRVAEFQILLPDEGHNLF